MSQDQDTKARATQIRNGETCTDLDVGNLLQVKRWPKWVLELAGEGDRFPLDPKWSEGIRTLEIEGVEFLVVDRYALDRSTTIGLVGGSCEYGFRFQILPHPDDREQVQILVWNDSDGRVSE